MYVIYTCRVHIEDLYIVHIENIEYRIYIVCVCECVCPFLRIDSLSLCLSRSLSLARSLSRALSFALSPSRVRSLSLALFLSRSLSFSRANLYTGFDGIQTGGSGVSIFGAATAR